MKKILIIIIILILPIVALAADLFSDGFESGDLSAWDNSVIDGGDLSAETEAALHGNYGLNCLIDDNTGIVVHDDGLSETRYRFRFYIDPNNLTMAEDNYIEICVTADGAWEIPVFIMYLSYSGGAYKISVLDATDGEWNKGSASYIITDAPHCIELDWTASSGVGQNNGEFSLWIDGVLKETVAGIDSDTEIVELIQLGVITGNSLGVGTHGTFFFDDFASNDDGSLIGQLGDADTFGCNF